MIVKLESAPKLMLFCSYELDYTHVYVQPAAPGCLQLAGNVKHTNKHAVQYQAPDLCCDLADDLHLSSLQYVNCYVGWHAN